MWPELCIAMYPRAPCGQAWLQGVAARACAHGVTVQICTSCVMAREYHATFMHVLQLLLLLVLRVTSGARLSSRVPVHPDVAPLQICSSPGSWLEQRPSPSHVSQSYAYESCMSTPRGPPRHARTAPLVSTAHSRAVVSPVICLLCSALPPLHRWVRMEACLYSLLAAVGGEAGLPVAVGL